MPKVTVVPPQVRYRFEDECKRHGMTVDSAIRAYNRGMNRNTNLIKQDREGRQLHTLQWALSYLTEGREHSDVDARRRVMQWTGRGERSAIAWVKGDRATPEYAVMLILEGVADMIEGELTNNHPLFIHIYSAALRDEDKAPINPRGLEPDFEKWLSYGCPNKYLPLPRDERETFREAYRDAFRLLIMEAYPYEDEDDDRLRAYYFLARASAPRIRALVAFLDAMDGKAVPHWERDDLDKNLWEAKAINAATGDLESLKSRVYSRHPDRKDDLIDLLMQEAGLSSSG